MSSIIIRQMPQFKNTYKKLHVSQKQKVDAAIKTIVTNPKIGEEKKGDLAGIFVHKFRIHHQEMLLAYEWNLYDRLLLALGTHQNFYRNLKRRK